VLTDRLGVSRVRENRVLGSVGAAGDGLMPEHRASSLAHRKRHGAKEPFRQRWLPMATLLLLTAVYGWSFVVVKDVISEYPVLPYLGLRFGIGVLTVLLLLRRLPSRADWRVGLPLSAALMLGYLSQTEGMVTISPGVAGLLTGLFVVFIPLLDRLFFGSRLRRRTVISVVAALIGTAMLTGAGAGFSVGDLLVALSALAFAGQMVMLSHTRGSAGQLGTVQMITCAVAFLTLGSTSGVPYPAVSGAVVIALLLTGVVTSGLAVVAQTWAQQQMSASSAGLILAAEPAFAVMFAVLLVGERLSSLQLLGALVLMAAIVGHGIASAGARRPPSPGGSARASSESAYHSV
jgi:drug/metabolite transporter (DMT)-like permease